MSKNRKEMKQGPGGSRTSMPSVMTSAPSSRSGLLKRMNDIRDGYLKKVLSDNPGLPIYPWYADDRLKELWDPNPDKNTPSQGVPISLVSPNALESKSKSKSSTILDKSCVVRESKPVHLQSILHDYFLPDPSVRVTCPFCRVSCSVVEQDPILIHCSPASWLPCCLSCKKSLREEKERDEDER